METNKTADNEGKSNFHECDTVTVSNDNNHVLRKPYRFSLRSFSKIAEAYYYMFVLSSLFGIHIISPDNNGNFTVSKWKTVLTIAFMIESICAFFIYVHLLMHQLPYWYIVIMLPTCYGIIYVMIIYVFVILNRHKCKKYLNELKLLEVQRKWFFYPKMIGSYCFCLFIAVPACVFLPSDYRFWLTHPTVVIFTVCLLQDIYTTTFLWCIAAGLQALEKEVMVTKDWSLSTVCHFSRQWLKMKKLLDLHNEVRFNFKYCFGKVSLINMSSWSLVHTTSFISIIMRK